MQWICFEPLGRRVPSQDKANIFEVARDAGIAMSSYCGGKGTCGKCKVRILSGNVTPPTETENECLSSEDMARGYRLACQTRVLGTVEIEIPKEFLVVSNRLQLSGDERESIVDPEVQSYTVELPLPTLHDARSDQVRLMEYLADKYENDTITHIDSSVMCRLPGLFRGNEWRAKIGIRGEEVVMAGGLEDRLVGVAVDLGSTKIAGYLNDIETGELLAAKGALNSQIAYGEDLLSRITYAMEGGREQIRQRTVRDLNELIQALCMEVNLSSERVVEAVVVGNTAMHHFFLGLPVRQLGQAPYVPAVSRFMDIKARDVGLDIAPGAYVHILPNIAGYVGADHVSTLLSTIPVDPEKPVFVLDIGTNTEICLAANGRLMSCSCASGPAFEGAHIKDGMRAAAGAIEKVRITDSAIEYRVIDDKPPIGLCGSGILDFIAQLRDAGIMNDRGKLQPHPSVRDSDNGKEFVLVSNGESGSNKAITLTERDISEIQLAKGAMGAGLKILLSEANIGWEEVGGIIVAGAFGSYIDIASAITIGMFPPLPQERFSQVGNAAGVGARLALISKTQRRLASEIAGRVEYIELTNCPDYQRTFVRALKLSSAEGWR